MGELNQVAAERQKLIHTGKVLKDEELVSQTALKEGDFVVLMVLTPKVSWQMTFFKILLAKRPSLQLGVCA